MNHIKAIHTLKTKIKMADGDYRALLQGLTGKDSCKAMNPVELAKVRSHFDNLSIRMGISAPKPQFITSKHGWQAGRIEQLWIELGQAGALTDPSPAGLGKFIQSKSATAVTTARFLPAKDASNIIEALKSWLARSRIKSAAVATL